MHEILTRLGRMQQVVGIDAVNHIYVMPLVAQSMRQTVQLHGVATKAVRRVKRGEVEEAEGAIGHRPCACAPVSQ